LLEQIKRLGFKQGREVAMHPQKLDVYNLIVFYFVASEKSITAAAEKLFLSQPTVTYHIKSLEKAVGVKLLDVKRKRLLLTNAGEGLFQYSKQIYQQLSDAERFIDDLKEANLRVGIAMSFSSTVASAASAFEELHPNVKLTVKHAPSFEVVQDVLSSQVELGVVVSMDYGIPKLRPIAISTKEKIVLVASPSSPIFQKEHLELRDLCDYPLILGPATSATRRVVFSKLEAEGLKVDPIIAVEVNSVEWGRSLVENGKGIGFYYARNVEKEVSEGRLRVLPITNDIRIGVDALVRRDALLPPIAERFISLLREAFLVPTNAYGEATPLSK
jgi:DNA-binding transcriptional LysR family regulator